MTTRNALLISHADDLHVVLVREELERLGWSAVVQDAARLAQCQIRLGEGVATVRYGRNELALDSLDLIWARRLYPRLAPQVASGDLTDSIVSESRSALLGAASVSHAGRFVHLVDCPYQVAWASNKLVQLDMARAVGLSVPSTLITQERGDVESLLVRVNKCIAKPLLGFPSESAVAEFLDMERLAALSSYIQVCPTIYQEYIEGDMHYRVHIIGDTCQTVCIRTQDVDWRRNLDRASFEVVQLDAIVAERLCALTRSLGLHMGVADMKVGRDGVPVFLEINPQGQFLFCQAFCAINLARFFAEGFDRIVGGGG